MCRSCTQTLQRAWKQPSKKLHSQQHKGYVSRTDAFMEKAEWVLLFRPDFETKGHNTNNYSEASIRILKDIVLRRTKPSMLLPLWNSWLSLGYRRRIIDHAHSCVAGNRRLYEKLLKRLSESARYKTVYCRSGLNVIPSGCEDGKTYEVDSSIGLCTCHSDQQGAFSKHQALVHKTFGGTFPNAPVLTREGRHELGRLALGDACTRAEIFVGLREKPSEPHDASSIEAASTEPLHSDNPLALGWNKLWAFKLPGSTREQGLSHCCFSLRQPKCLSYSDTVLQVDTFYIVPLVVFKGILLLNPDIANFYITKFTI